MRLDKFVCKSTEFTKHEAVRLIQAGEIIVNGKAITNESAQVHENNKITLHGEALKSRAFRYILLHKPANTICSNIDEHYPSLFNCLDVEKQAELHVVGRLDVDTTGLVLITDDGRWSFGVTNPAGHCSKVYRVGLSRPVAEEVVSLFAEGIRLQGEAQLTLPAQLEVINSKEVLLTLTQGKFHQVKRMFAAVGNRVVSLKREKIGNISLDVAVGEWRYLTDAEVISVNKSSI
ncbi:pseudouridine synthase [Amphritea balenae]|uniref:Pseudouridine synthase n=1 Tax=Amphritea balenae TaxID=452629 RepID=A0A3P1STJ8_9GAMM|nr:pseudouridine synthase [Amphritea balenae]RRD00537.1 pseudouridine synthase [Amphritea balenae]GGK69912.1 pseudouridine synthase [Amphritea balenae]